MGEIEGATPNPTARGGETVIDRCACGAKRMTNVNGEARERGPWIARRMPKRAAELEAANAESEVLEEVVRETLGEKTTRVISEKQVSALRRNARLAGRPRGKRSEEVVEERFVEGGVVDNPVAAGAAVLVRLIKIVTPSGKRTWEIRCSCDGEDFRYVPSVIKPDFETFCGSK